MLDFFGGWNFQDIRNPKLFHVACHSLSQIDVTKLLRRILAVGLRLTHDLEYWSNSFATSITKLYDDHWDPLTSSASDKWSQQ